MRFLFPALIGAVAGVGATIVVWKIASKKIDAEFASAGTRLIESGSASLRSGIATAVQQEVPPRVRAEIETKFREYGLTPSTGRQIATVLNAADRMGII